jgi:hypothetical protein
VNFSFRNHPYFLQFNLETILFIKYFLFFFESLIAVVELGPQQILLLLFSLHRIALSRLVPFQNLLLSFHISFFAFELHLYLKMIDLIFFFRMIFSLLLMKLKQMNRSLLILIIPFPFHHYLQ